MTEDISKGVIRRNRDKKIVGTWRIVSGKRLLNSVNDQDLKSIILRLYRNGVIDPLGDNTSYNNATFMEISSYMSIRGYTLLDEDIDQYQANVDIQRTREIYPRHIGGGIIMNGVTAQVVGYWEIKPDGVKLFPNRLPESAEIINQLTSSIRVHMSYPGKKGKFVTPQKLDVSSINSNINNNKYFLVSWETVKATEEDWK